MNIELIIIIASVIGTIAFSISGALIAIECNLDILGVILLGAITACGGGIIRDVMLNAEIAMFDDPIYALLSLLTCLLVFLIMRHLKNLSWENSKLYKIIFNVIDSIGLGAFVVVGANAAINNGATTMFAVCFYGVLTAVGGGIIRDLVVNKIPAVFRKHIYAVAAIIGAIYFYCVVQLGVTYSSSVISTVLLVTVIRYFSFHFELGLPRVNLKANNEIKNF